MLIARAETAAGVQRDVRIHGGRIIEVADRLRPATGEDELDAAGGALLPGLHDHHVHLRAAAAAMSSIDAGPAAVADASGLRRALLAAATRRSPGGWLRAVGYHDVVAGALDRWRLDALSPPATPVRVQHRSGILWVLNSAAVDATGLARLDEPGVERDDAGRPTGRIWRRDDLVRRLTDAPPPDLGAVGRAASAMGVTGLTDATPHPEPTGARDLARDLRAAGVAQRLLVMGPVGSTPPEGSGAELGPVKVLLDDDRLPTVDDLADTVAAAHREGRPVAVHCVTRLQLVVTLTALEQAGATGDRIEHGSVIPPELIERLRAMDLTVVSQPHFVAERGDEYLAEVDEADRASLYRAASLVAAGVKLAAGTDAPFGALDPWASVAAAAHRRTRTGRSLGPEERLPVDQALACYLGHGHDPATARVVTVGADADLCLLGVAWDGLPGCLAAPPVRATLVAGEVVYGGDP